MEDSIFTYSVGQNWSTYYFPNFEPVFEILFADPALQQAADEMCGDDIFCRFDIATTESTDIGLSTLMGGQEFEEIVNNSRPSELTVHMHKNAHAYMHPHSHTDACVRTHTLTCTYTHPCKHNYSIVVRPWECETRCMVEYHFPKF